jgi:hypothetical protein
MPSRLALFATVILMFPQTLNAQSYEEELRARSAMAVEAWNTQDVAAISTAGFTVGFGFRTYAPRSGEALPPAAATQLLERFFDSLDYYRIIPDETNIVIDGDIALVWGYHIEEFKHKGLQEERVRVRSSSTLKRVGDGQWKTLLSHRDIQPFDENGRYIQNFVE